MTERKLKYLVILIFLLITFGIIVLFLFPKAKSVEVSFDYSDDCILGIDVPVEGLEVWIFSDGSFIYTLYTDSSGTITFYMFDLADYEVKYRWNNTIQTMGIVGDGTQNVVLEEVISAVEVDGTFKWDTPLQELVLNKTLDLYQFNGTDWNIVATITTDPLTGECIFYLPMGTFSFDTVDTIVIDRNTVSPIVDTYLVEALLFIISIIIGIGILITNRISERTNLFRKYHPFNKNKISYYNHWIFVFWLSMKEYLNFALLLPLFDYSRDHLYKNEVKLK